MYEESRHDAQKIFNTLSEYMQHLGYLAYNLAEEPETLEQLVEPIRDEFERLKSSGQIPNQAMEEIITEINEVLFNYFMKYGIPLIQSSSTNCSLPEHDSFPHEHNLKWFHKTCQDKPKDHKFCSNHNLSVCVICGGDLQ